MATRDVFSEEELEQLRGFPDVGRAELIRYFTLAVPDEMFVRKFRGKPNVLGAAVQLCTLPWLGFVPDEVRSAPVEAVTRLAERLDIRARLLAEYGVREQTRTDHLREIAGYLGWRSADEMEWKQLQEFLFSRAMEHDSPRLLFRLACEHLMSVRVVRPGAVNILERVATARDRALAETWTRVEHLVQGEQRRAELDGLLMVDPYLGRTPLAWLGTGPTQASPAAVKGELEKLAYLRRLDAHTLDLSVLPAERRRFLAGVGSRSTAQALQRRDPERRYPILLTQIAQSAVDVLDEVLLLFDQALSARETVARAKMNEALAERAKGGENRQALLDEILTIVLDPAVGDDAVGSLLRERVGMDRMRAAWAARQERLPRDHGHLSMLDASMPYLRQFAPDVLAAVRFAGGVGTDELLRAVSILAELYATGARKVPAGAPAGFVPTKWAGYLAAAVEAGDITAYRHYWELCVLIGLRDGLRSGDVPDGHLGNATDLPVVEHATDTHGASLANFALFDLVGRQLSPRIRDLGKITLYRTGPKADFVARYPHAGPLLTRKLNTDLITATWDDLLRVAASVKYGHAAAALVVGKLCSSRRQQNALTSAIKEYGALRRTVYAARYLADESYRRRIARQLNKGENLHALRRELAYAGEGAVRRRHHEQQSEQMWCLTLATNAIVTWTTEYYGLAVGALRRSGRPVDDDLLAHIWPSHHTNVNFYGTHSVDIDGELAKLDADGYRPLRLPAS